MEKNKIIFGVLILLVGIAAGFSLYPTYQHQQQIKLGNQAVISWDNIPTKGENGSNYAVVQKTSETAESLGIVYQNEKLDTSNWVEYRSEYSGFSVVAPKERSYIFCTVGNFETGACDPKIYGEFFQYSLSDNLDGSGSLYPGLKILIVKKRDGTNLNNWISKYVSSGVYGFNNLTDIKNTSVSKYSAISFDVKNHDGVPVGVKYSDYPQGVEFDHTFGNMPSYSPILHCLVMDLGDKYGLVLYQLNIDKNSFEKEILSYNYLAARQSILLDNKTLPDVYKAILESFHAFTPTKS